MTKLYELPEQYQHFYQTMVENEGEFPMEASVVLEAIDDEFRAKVESCCKILADLQLKSECFDNEARRMLSRARSLKNRAKWLKKYMQENMEKMGIEEVDGDLFKAKVCVNPPSVLIRDMDSVPPEFDRIREREVSKQEIKEALASGKHVPGCELVRSKGLRVT